MRVDGQGRAVESLESKQSSLAKKNGSAKESGTTTTTTTTLPLTDTQASNKNRIFLSIGFRWIAHSVAVIFPAVRTLPTAWQPPPLLAFSAVQPSELWT